jgi:hypothetical protein
MGSSALIDPMTESQQITLSIEEVDRKRQEARQVLESLVATRSSSEQSPSSSVSDLFKRVTGHSSIENAIQKARRTVEAYDRIYADMQRLLTSGVPVPSIKVTVNGVPSVL